MKDFAHEEVFLTQSEVTVWISLPGHVVEVGGRGG